MYKSTLRNIPEDLNLHVVSHDGGVVTIMSAVNETLILNINVISVKFSF
jgi:hypothetical protein